MGDIAANVGLSVHVVPTSSSTSTITAERLWALSPKSGLTARNSASRRIALKLIFPGSARWMTSACWLGLQCFSTCSTSSRRKVKTEQPKPAQTAFNQKPCLVECITKVQAQSSGQRASNWLMRPWFEDAQGKDYQFCRSG